MKNLKWIIVIIISIVLLLIVIRIYIGRDILVALIPSIEQAQLVGKLITKPNKVLSDNINKYYGSASRWDQAWDCANILYGYDDKYAYALMQCSRYVHQEYGGVEEESGISGAVRFEYDKNTFEIKGDQAPEDGGGLASSERRLFPFEVYKHLKYEGIQTEDNIQRFNILTKELKQKFFNSIDPKLLSILEAVSLKYPELKDWPYNYSEVPNGFGFKVQNGSYYLAYFKGIGGRNNYAYDPKCFEVKSDSQILEIKASNIDSTTSIIDPISCKGISLPFELDRRINP